MIDEQENKNPSSLDVEVLRRKSRPIIIEDDDSESEIQRTTR